MKLIIPSAFILLFASVGWGQTPPCRKVEIDAPSGYLLPGHVYYVSARVNYYSGAPELTYQWRLPQKPQFEILDDGFGAAFVPSEEMNGLEVSVFLTASEKNGNCRSEAAASFRILFNPGTPLMLDEYRELSVKDERARLDALASEMKAKGYSALFSVRYKNTETRASVTARVNRIITHLVNRRGIPRNKLYFAFMETEWSGVMIYANPPADFGDADPFPSIKNLDIPRTPMQKKP